MGRKICESSDSKLTTEFLLGGISKLRILAISASGWGELGRGTTAAVNRSGDKQRVGGGGDRSDRLVSPGDIARSGGRGGFSLTVIFVCIMLRPWSPHCVFSATVSVPGRICFLKHVQNAGVVPDPLRGKFHRQPCLDLFSII